MPSPRQPWRQLGVSTPLSLAKEVIGLNEQIAEIDKLIMARFREHELAEVISSMPGIGTLLGAEFLAATADDMSRFGSSDCLASFAGVAPVPRDSGNVSGNLHRPRRYHRGLQRVFYTSPLISIRSCDASRRFYERKRAKANGTPRPSSRCPGDGPVPAPSFRADVGAVHAGP